MPAIKLSDFERDLFARRQALGLTAADDAALRNSGAARSPAKRRLLQILADEARTSGREPAFPANF